MNEQRSIPRHKVARAMSLAGTGLRIGLNYARYHTSPEKDRERLHQANASDAYAGLSRLKGGPLKVAQMLSIDQSLLPPAYATEFAKAQYSAPPLSFPLVVRTFHKELGAHPDQIYDRFERQAASGASIGQVHRAWKDDRKLAVKVQYPGVADSLKSDLRLVRPFAERLFNITPAELDYYMEEVQERLLEETDYCLERERGSELAARCQHLPGISFPAYDPGLSTRKILTMDWVEGLPLDRFADQEPSQEARNRVGQALWDFYHYQVHTLRVFHADPHPGNFIVAPDTLWVLDFGCVKSVPEAFYTRYFRLLDPSLVDDPKRLKEALAELTLLLPQDSPSEQALLRDVFRESVILLSRPFREATFDFGDPAYMQAIRDFGETTGNDPRLKKISSARGSPHAIYINRAYFGLYSLLARMRSRIEARLPDWI